MPYPRVKPCCVAISLLSVLGGLPGCANVRYKDRVTEVPVPVRVPVDPRLTADCAPRFDVPGAGPLTLFDVLSRLAAAEEALQQCRNQLNEIRNLK